MNNDMSKLIDEVERLDREATPGPWHHRDAETENGYSTSAVSPDSEEEDGLSPEQLTIAGRTIAIGLSGNDAALIALCRTAAPVLAAEVERLDARLAEVERERDEALLTLAAEQGRQEGAPSKRWHYVGNEDGFDEERGEWRRRDGAVKVWWDNGRWIWGRRAQPGVYVAERGQPDDQPARVAMLAADAATG